MTVWGVGDKELADAFDIDQASIRRWLEDGIPTSHRDAANKLSKSTEALSRHLRPEALPVIVQRAMPAIGGQALVDLLRDGRFDELLQVTRDMFQFEAANG